VAGGLSCDGLGINDRPGPGVTPDISWEGPGLHSYNPKNPGDVAYEQAGNAILDSYRDRLCRQH